MKIRSGFVSNSSSSSFVLFGAYINELPEGVEYDNYSGDGIRYYEDEESGPVVGVFPDEMGMDETLRQFQIRIAQKLKEAGVEVKPEKLGFTGGSYYC